MTYGDINNTRMETVFDFVKMMFEREHELFLDNLPDDHSLVNLPGKEQIHFDILFNEDAGTMFVTSEKEDASPFKSQLHFMVHVTFEIRLDICQLFGWV